VAVFGFALISAKRFIRVVVIAPGHGGREIGLWREIIFDYDLMRFDTTGLVRSSSPYHPRGAPIFPCTAEGKQERKHKRNQIKKKHDEARTYR